MDDEDIEFVESLNLGVDPFAQISELEFEYCLDRLERCAARRHCYVNFDALAVLPSVDTLDSRVSLVKSVLGKFQNVDARPVPRSLERDLTEEVICGVCGNDDSFSDDEILLCDGCDISVHQSCYGVPKVPAGDWKCSICRSRPAASQKSSI